MRGILTAAAALLVAASLLACGGDGDGEVTAVTTTVTNETTDTTDTTATTETTDTTATTTTTEPTTVLGSAEAMLAGVAVRADITELVREGQFATLDFTVTNLAPRRSDVFFFRSFDDTGNGSAADGLLLIDPRNGKEYRVVRNPGQGCLCSDEIPSPLGPRESVDLFATFEAPPLSASRVHVSFPGSLGTITGVPLDSAD